MGGPVLKHSAARLLNITTIALFMGIFEHAVQFNKDDDTFMCERAMSV